MTFASQMLDFFLSVPALLYVTLGLLAVWYFWGRRSNHGNIPPFPVRPFPLLGHAPYMRREGAINTLSKWRKMKGDIYSIYMGGTLSVVISDFDILKEAFVKKAENISNRPTLPHMVGREINNGGNIGILRNNGESWKETRSVSMQILRNFGMGKNFLADKILEEVEAYLGSLSNLKGQPKDVRLLTNAAVSNVICAILVGHRFEFEDPDFVKLLKLLNEQVALVGTGGALQVLPILYYLPGDLFNIKKVINNSKQLIALCSEKFVSQIKASGESNNFISSFFAEMERKNKANIPTYLDERNLLSVISNLFAAGSETTSTTIGWALLFAVRSPDIQEKLYKEIVEVVGEERLPNMLDKPKLNFVSAFIMETQRLGSIVPTGGIHSCTKTTEVAGYTIPEGANVIPLLHEILLDEKTWEDPLEFRPERFLDQEGNVFVPKHFIPFSIGRRYCMGESLARMELFLFISGIFQRFKVAPEDPDHLPPIERIPGLTSPPKAFNVRFIKRRLE